MLDEFRSTNITWDKATRRIYSPISANESDSNGRKLNIQVVNSGQVENLAGATLHLYWETKDKAKHGLDAFTASDISKGEFEIFYTTAMLSNVGELNATLVLVDSTGKVVSDWFKITVARGINESAIESENSFSSLTQALTDLSDLEQNYAPRLNDLTAQLVESEKKASWVDPVNDFGADPTGTRDSYQNIMNAIQHMRDNNITYMKFPEISGTFLLSKPIIFNISNGVLDLGNNLFKQATNFSNGGFLYTCLLFIGNTSPIYINNVTVKNGRFEDFVGDLSAKVIRGKYINTLNLSNLISKNSTGEFIFIGASSNVDVDRIEVNGSELHGISFDQIDGTELVEVSNWTVRNSVFKNCAWMGIDGHSAYGTEGKIENCKFIDCSQLGKNESGRAVVKGNSFIWTNNFVYKSHIDETSLYYGYNDYLEFTDNIFLLNGNKAHARFILALWPAFDRGKSMKVKGNTFIDKTSKKAWDGLITAYSSGTPFLDLDITDNHFESDNIEKLAFYISNSTRTKFDSNTCILGVTGLNNEGYYGLRTDVLSKNLSIKGNTFELKGALGSQAFRIIMVHGTTEGYTKIEENSIAAEGLTGDGAVYHTQFIGGTGYKLYKDNILTGTGTALLGTSVIEKDNYTDGQAVISTIED